MEEMENSESVSGFEQFMKSLEEMQNKEAVAKFSSSLSGRNLPFSSLSEKLDKKKDEDK